MKKISKELMGASSTPLILSLLNQRDAYGYEIVLTIRELSDDRIVWKEGSIYPALKNLEKHGLIRSYWFDNPGHHRRRYYAIEDKGKEALKEEKEQWSLMQSIFHKIWVLQQGLP